jgi:hypothetical protein
MKLWLKALLISVVILAGSILYLPTLAKQGINSLLPWAMDQVDFEQGQANISQLTWHSLHIDQIQFFLPSHNSQINLQDIEVTFSPWGIASGQLKDATVKRARIEVLPSTFDNNIDNKKTDNQNLALNTPREVASNKTPAFELPSLETIFQQLPINNVTIEQFQLVHPHAVIDSQIAFNKQQFSINNTIQTHHLTKELTHQFRQYQEPYFY